MKLFQIAGTVRLAVNLAVFIAAGIGLAVAQTGTPPTPSMDKRMEGAYALQLTKQRQEAADRLQTRLPGIAGDYDLITGAPNWIWSNSRFLSGPATEDEILHPRVARTSTGTAPQAEDHSLCFSFEKLGFGPKLQSSPLLLNSRIANTLVQMHDSN